MTRRRFCVKCGSTLIHEHRILHKTGPTVGVSCVEIRSVEPYCVYEGMCLEVRRSAA